jgi:hypothetical protein
VPQVTGVQLVPVIGENTPISETSLGCKGVGEFCHWGEAKMGRLSIEPAKTRQQGSGSVSIMFKLWKIFLFPLFACTHLL